MGLRVGGRVKGWLGFVGVGMGLGLRDRVKG